MLLIIASSGRMLAQIAQRLGFETLVIDLYVDKDTVQAALKVWQVQDLSLNQLIPIIDTIKQNYAVDYLIYGSGFEQYVDSLCYLETEFNLIGNTSEVFNGVQNKIYFFNTLKQHHIPHPNTQFTPPNYKANWLIKPLQGQGGLGVGYYQNQNNKNSYWQQYQTGSVHSVLFLADIENINIVGFNTQWTTQGFLFAGIVNYCPIPEQKKLEVIDYTRRLSAVFNLHGLNSLDFIYHDNKVYVLEINARIPASLQLYDDELLLSHIEKPQRLLKPLRFITAYEIIYAERQIIVPDIVWQTGFVDLPETGRIIQQGEPICSIIARALTLEDTLEILQQQKRWLFALIE